MLTFFKRGGLLLFALVSVCNGFIISTNTFQHKSSPLHVTIKKEYLNPPIPRPKAVNEVIIEGKKIRNQGAPRDREINNPNKLKIIAGIAKGTKLDSPDVYLRPMMSKVREALFSTLDYLDVFTGNNTRVLDTFSGSGSVGLEALSRGASHTTFVDLAKDCTEVSLRNAVKCGFKNQVQAVCARAEEVLQNPLKYGLTQPYDLISITPPYLEVSYDELIRSVANSSLVTEDTIVILEYPTEMGLFPHILETDKLYGIRNRRYGRTMLGIYVYRPSQIYDMRVDEFKI